MAKIKRYEYRDNRDRRDSDGLKQRRLKDESRWKFRPTKDYMEESQDDDLGDFDEYSEEEYR